MSPLLQKEIKVQKSASKEKPEKKKQYTKAFDITSFDEKKKEEPLVYK